MTAPAGGAGAVDTSGAGWATVAVRAWASGGPNSSSAQRAHTHPQPLMMCRLRKRAKMAPEAPTEALLSPKT